MTIEKTCSAGIGANVTIVEGGFEHRTLLGKRTYEWAQLEKIVVTANGRRVIREETPFATLQGAGVFREPNFVALLSLKGRLRRISLTSGDREVFFAALREIWSKATELGVPITTSAIECSRSEFEDWLGVA